MFFSRAVVAFALAASIVAPSLVAAQEHDNLSARELRDTAVHFQRRAAIAEVMEAIEARGNSPKIVTTRYCNGPAIMEKKTNEHGKVVSTDVHTICSPPAVCVQHGNGRVLCGKK